MDTGDWLRRIGLGQYDSLFRTNEIDGEVLPDLTDADLEKLGIAFGHRKRILKAIANLPIDAEDREHRGLRSPIDAAERRQLTIMFCDLVGSTALSARLDPEDMRAVIATYQKCCAGLIESNGGFVAKYMGDGLLAYFGYPQAHEHDAERSVRAGLAIVETLPQLDLPQCGPLHARVGIATGIVVVGDLLGAGEARERGVVGETPNLAARLQALASPDHVVIAEGTRRLLGELFELADLGRQDLKGIAGQTPAWAVLGQSTRESRFEALHADGLTQLVGREEESEVFSRRWDRARSGEGQVVMLSGEPGIGKSRLVASFLTEAAEDRHGRFRYYCSPQHVDSTLFPVIEQIERAAGLDRNDDVKTKLRKLDAKLKAWDLSDTDAELIIQLLSLSNEEPSLGAKWPSALRRQKTMDVLISQIDIAARESPVLLVFEDVHWADASSLEFLGRLIEKIATIPALLFLTFRPEYLAPWSGRAHVTALTINRLTNAEVERLIDTVAGRGALRTDLRQDIVERADGIPLFVEEMAKAVIEAQSDGSKAHLISVIPSPSLPVPASLHASLMARLDRLGNAKTIAQIGAAIGREFSYEVLARVAGLPDPTVSAALDRLVHSGLLSCQGEPPHSTYLFKHALVQDAAYGTLLREPRRALHARIVETLKDYFPDLAESRPELLARHCTEAGLVEEAAMLLTEAGQQSLSRSANIEAEAQFKRALVMLATLPEAADLRREQIRASIGLANALMYNRGYVARETRDAFDEARRLVDHAERLGDSLEDPYVMSAVLFGFWVANFVAFDATAVCDVAAEALAVAGPEGDPVPRLVGHALLGAALVVSGDFAAGLDHLTKSMAVHDPDRHSALLSLRFGMDFRSGFLTFRASALWLLGDVLAAREDVEEAIAEARRIAHIPTLMVVLHLTGATQIRLGDFAAAKAQADELLSLAQEKQAPFYIAHGMADRACALAADGQGKQAIQAMEEALDAYRLLASTVELPYLLSVMAKAHAELGEFEKARGRIEEAMKRIDVSGERWCEADIHRVAGEIEWMSHDGRESAAAGHFARALEIARSQNSPTFELRAAIGLCKLLRDQGRSDEAQAVLAPLWTRFVHDTPMPERKEAEELLIKAVS